MQNERKAAVVGAGIVGLAVAYHLSRAGMTVTVIDRDPEGDRASLGNAGAIAVTEVVPASSPDVWRRVPGWLIDPLGPLSIRPRHALKLIPWLAWFAKSGTNREVERISQALANLNRRVYGDLLPMLEEIGFAQTLRRTGALSVYETEDGYRSDVAEWNRKRALGIQVEELSGDDVRRMEPALGPRARRAVFTPQWSHVEDPAALVRQLRQWLIGRGVTVLKGEVQQLIRNGAELKIATEGGNAISASCAVIAAGAWSGRLAHRSGDRVLLESERGYNTTLPEPGIAVARQLIFPERKFVATPLSCGLRIGGAAEFGGLSAPANFKRSAALLGLATGYLPDLRRDGGTQWAGHRPATPDSLPVIGPSPLDPRILYAFGHGHLGLTQAATTGRLISDLILQRNPAIDMTPYSIARFAARTH